MMEKMKMMMEMIKELVIMKTKNQQKKVEIREYQDLIITIWFNQNQSTQPCINLYNNFPKIFSLLYFKNNEQTIQGREKGRLSKMTSQMGFFDCIKTYQKSLNRQILEQNSFFFDGIKELTTSCSDQKNNGSKN
jgi:hypothetical protein